MKYALITILSILIILVTSTLIFEIDKSTGNNIYKEYVVKPDCNYRLPNQYFLVKDTVKNVYAIRFMHLDEFTNYLKVHRYLTIPNFMSNMGDYEDATTFEDSCKAKGFLKMFIESKKEDKDNFIVQ